MKTDFEAYIDGQHEEIERLKCEAADRLEALKDVVCAFAMNNAEPEELRDALVNPILKASALITKAEGR